MRKKTQKNSNKHKEEPGKTDGIESSGKQKAREIKRSEKNLPEDSKKKSRGKSNTKKKENVKFKGLSLVKEEIEKELEKFADKDLRNLKGYSDREKVVILQNELINRIKISDDYKETLQRVAADLDNFRKRAEKDKKNTVKYANESLILKLLDVIDNLERALESHEKKKESGFYQGIELIYNQLIKIMTDEGLEPINETNVKFNPHKHDAMMQIVNNKLNEDTVTDILNKGYILEGKVIRPAKVRISKQEE